MNKPLEFHTRVVVFIDILGFRNLVEEAARYPVGDVSIRLSAALEEIQNFSSSKSQLINDLSELDKKFQIKIFSDSIIISCTPKAEDVRRLFLKLNRLFVILMIQGIWVRGGISHDRISIRQQFLCGPAVNKAYDIESKIAKNPRIALASSAVNFCREIMPDIFESHCIERDEDGVYLLSPLKLATENHDVFGLDIRDYATIIRDNLDRDLAKIVERPDHYAKIDDLAQRSNEIADKKKGFFEQSYRTKGYVDLVDTYNEATTQFLSGLPEAP